MACGRCLTMLGIIIGVGAVITSMAIGSGAQTAVLAQIESLGANLVVISPGAITSGGVSLGTGSRTSLTLPDVRRSRRSSRTSSGRRRTRRRAPRWSPARPTGHSDRRHNASVHDGADWAVAQGTLLHPGRGRPSGEGRGARRHRRPEPVPQRRRGRRDRRSSRTSRFA